VEDELAPIDFICVDPEHIRIGHGVRDGEGHLTLHLGRWGYCSAALPNVRHQWQETGGISFKSIVHRSLPPSVDPS
jgi:hypothetical protein